MKDFNQKLTRPLQLRKQRDRKKEPKGPSWLLLFFLAALAAMAWIYFSGHIHSLIEWFYTPQ